MKKVKKCWSCLVQRFIKPPNMGLHDSLMDGILHGVQLKPVPALLSDPVSPKRLKRCDECITALDAIEARHQNCLQYCLHHACVTLDKCVDRCVDLEWKQGLELCITDPSMFFERVFVTPKLLGVYFEPHISDEFLRWLYVGYFQPFVVEEIADTFYQNMWYRQCIQTNRLGLLKWSLHRVYNGSLVWRHDADLREVLLRTALQSNPGVDMFDFLIFGDAQHIADSYLISAVRSGQFNIFEYLMKIIAPEVYACVFPCFTSVHDVFDIHIQIEWAEVMMCLINKHPYEAYVLRWLDAAEFNFDRLFQSPAQASKTFELLLNRSWDQTIETILQHPGLTPWHRNQIERFALTYAGSTFDVRLEKKHSPFEERNEKEETYLRTLESWLHRWSNRHSVHVDSTWLYTMCCRFSRWHEVLRLFIKYESSLELHEQLFDGNWMTAITEHVALNDINVHVVEEWWELILRISQRYNQPLIPVKHMAWVSRMESSEWRFEEHEEVQLASLTQQRLHQMDEAEQNLPYDPVGAMRARMMYYYPPETLITSDRIFPTSLGWYHLMLSTCERLFETCQKFNAMMSRPLEWKVYHRVRTQHEECDAATPFHEDAAICNAINHLYNYDSYTYDCDDPMVMVKTVLMKLGVGMLDWQLWLPLERMGCMMKVSVSKGTIALWKGINEWCKLYFRTLRRDKEMKNLFIHSPEWWMSLFAFYDRCKRDKLPILFRHGPYLWVEKAKHAYFKLQTQRRKAAQTTLCERGIPQQVVNHVVGLYTDW